MGKPRAGVRDAVGRGGRLTSHSEEDVPNAVSWVRSSESTSVLEFDGRVPGRIIATGNTEVC